MPNKTIYVSEDDMALFERAQELAGSNLSSAIVKALRRYIELEDARQNGFEEITVIVNTEGAHRRKRFLGYPLARMLQTTADGKGTHIYVVYRTAGGRYALHTRTISDWELDWGDPDASRHAETSGLGSGLLKRLSSMGYASWQAYRDAGDYTLQVFDTLEDMKPHVNKDLFALVSQAMDGPPVEDIDI